MTTPDFNALLSLYRAELLERVVPFLDHIWRGLGEGRHLHLPQRSRRATQPQQIHVVATARHLDIFHALQLHRAQTGVARYC